MRAFVFSLLCLDVAAAPAAEQGAQDADRHASSGAPDRSLQDLSSISDLLGSLLEQYGGSLGDLPNMFAGGDGISTTAAPDFYSLILRHAEEVYGMPLGSGCSAPDAGQSRVCKAGHMLCNQIMLDLLASHCCNETGTIQLCNLEIELPTIELNYGALPMDMSPFVLAPTNFSSLHVTLVNGSLTTFASSATESARDWSPHGLNIRQVTGDVLVLGDRGVMQTLEGFQALEEIGGDLIVSPWKFNVSDPVLSKFVPGQDPSPDIYLPNLRRVNGRVVLKGAPNNNMRGLGALHHVGGDLTIKGWENLTSFEGLENLEFVGSLQLHNLECAESCPNLTFHTLRNLQFNRLEIKGTNLRSLEGLPAVSQLEDLILEDNAMLSDIEALSQLEVVAGTLSIKNTALTSLQGLRNLRRVGRQLSPTSLSISQNQLLESLLGLGKLQVVDGDLLINNNPRLRSLDGLGLASLLSVDRDVYVSSNMALHSLQGLDLATARGAYVSNQPLHYLGNSFSGAQGHCPTSPMLGEVLQLDPATSWPLCVAPLEWERVASRWLGVPGDHKGWDWWRNNSCGPEPATCWVGADCHIRVSGIASWSATSGVALPQCGLSCGPCGDQPQAFPQVAPQFVNVRHLLHAEGTGPHLLCHCSGSMVGLGAITEVYFAGPLLNQTATTYDCVRGHTCTLAIPGYGFQEGAVVEVRQGTCQGQLVAQAAFKSDSATFHLGKEQLLEYDPKTYPICWSPPKAACPDARACTTLWIGMLALQGPFKVSEQVNLDEQLLLANLGVGMRTDDRLELLDSCGVPRPQSRLHAKADDMQFRVDLNRSVAQPTQYRLCWCRPEATQLECTHAEDFIVDFGSLDVACPGEEVPTPDGCQACPVGKSLGLTADRVCTFDQVYVTLLSAQSLLLFAALTLALSRIHVPLVIEDCSTKGGKTIVEFTRPHQLHMYGRKSFRVTAHGTNARPLRVPLQARVKSKEALELFVPEKAGRVDETSGFLRLSLTGELLHFGWPIPAVVWLMLLLVSVLALGLVVEQQLRHAGVGAGSATVAALLVGAVLRRQKPNSLSKKLSQFTARMLEDNPSPQEVPKGPGRAVSLETLYDVLGTFGPWIRDRNAYHLDSNIIQPLTKRFKLSFAEVVGPKAVQWFVSHFWGNPFVDLCKALKKHADTMAARAGKDADFALQTTYWICFLSNNQHKVSDELGKDWSESSFYITLKSGLCQGVCMILDEDVQPLTRSWCIFELMQTLVLERNDPNFAGLLMCTEGGIMNYGQGSVTVAFNLVQRIADLDLASARASRQEDRDMINAQVVQELGGFGKMKDLVRVKLHSILVNAQGTASSQFQRLFQRVRPASPAIGPFVNLAPPAPIGIVSTPSNP